MTNENPEVQTVEVLAEPPAADPKSAHATPGGNPVVERQSRERDYEIPTGPQTPHRVLNNLSVEDTTTSIEG